MANNRFGKGGAYKCRACDKLTRETGTDAADVGLCNYCLEESYIENALSDGQISQVEFDSKIAELKKRYNR